MKLSCIILFTIVFAACNVGNSPKYKPYFEFDQLVHYSIKLSLEEEMKLIEADSLSEKEIHLNDVIIQPERTKLADTIQFIGLEKIGFIKKNIQPSKFQAINSLFCEKPHKEILSTSCVPFYRDILIFRNKGQIVGTAKVCFECGYHVIAGAKVNTDDFGQSGDYERLQNLLYESKALQN